MEAFTILIDTVNDYKGEPYVEGIYPHPIKAQERFKEIKEEAKKIWTKDEYTIGTDNDTCFEAYKDGCAAQEHCTIKLIRREIGRADGNPSMESMTLLRRNIDALIKKLEYHATAVLIDILESRGLKELDFSLLTDDEEENSCIEDTYSNRVSIERWTKNNVWYEIHPTAISLEYIPFGATEINFRCTDSICSETETLDTTELDTKHLEKLALTLYRYLSDPDKYGIKLTTENGTGILRPKTQYTKMYQPSSPEGTPDSLPSFGAFLTREACEKWMRSNSLEPCDWDIEEYSPSDIEGPTLLSPNGSKTPLLLASVTANGRTTDLLFPAPEDENTDRTQHLRDILQKTGFIPDNDASGKIECRIIEEGDTEYAGHPASLILIPEPVWFL